MTKEDEILQRLQAIQARLDAYFPEREPLLCYACKKNLIGDGLSTVCKECFDAL